MQRVCTDSSMSLAKALAGKYIPHDIKCVLSLITIPHVGFDGRVHQGYLLVHRKVARELRDIFDDLLRAQFPIERMIPIAAFGWDDDISMVANNTSAFNYRLIAGTDKLSLHAYGVAVDINPVLNPCHHGNGSVAPAGAHYDATVPGTITSEVAALFEGRGWEWGGRWGSPKDYQHFQKPSVLS